MAADTSARTLKDMPQKPAPRVVVTHQLPAPVEQRMAELFDVQLRGDAAPLSRADLVEAVAHADILVPTVTDRIDAELLSHAGPSLGMIANFGTGVDHIDLAAAKERDLVVTNTPGVLTEDTADIAMALILAGLRRLVEGDRLVRQDRWRGWSPTFMLGTRLAGKALGIVGMGRIGAALARRAHCFGMEIHYHNRQPAAPEIAEPLGARYWPELEPMLAAVDVVSLNCPSTPATHHLLSAARLAVLKPTSFVVNTARGPVIDEAALIEGLRQGRIAGAGLDVYENEPDLRRDFLTLDNVVLAPHLGSATLETRIAMGEKVIANIQTFWDGHRPPDRVIDGLV